MTWSIVVRAPVLCVDDWLVLLPDFEDDPDDVDDEEEDEDFDEEPAVPPVEATPLGLMVSLLVAPEAVCCEAFELVGSAAPPPPPQAESTKDKTNMDG